MSHPLVSILIAAYNAEPWIAETLESAIAQTWPHTEVIVVDDGSTDGTLAIARRYKSERVRVIAQANAGACAARNRALAEARGDFIQYLDADDLLSPNKIERQVALLAEAPEGCVAVCGTVYFDDGTDPEQGWFSPGGPAVNSDDPLQWLIDLWTPGSEAVRWGMVQTGAWLMPRRVAERAGPWDPAVTQDQDGEYFARVLLASTGVRWEPEGRVYYRKFERPGSVSSGRSRRALQGRLRAIDSKAHHVLPRTTDANRAQARAVLARQYLDVAFHAHPTLPDLVGEAERKARSLGHHHMSFFHRTRLRHVERWAGWKVAKRLSHTYRTLRNRLSS